MTVEGLLTDAEACVREYCVYVSYDRDAALARGDRDAAEVLARRWRAAGILADELRAANPDVIAADPWVVEEVRTLARQLAWRLGVIASNPAARRRRPPEPDATYSDPCPLAVPPSAGARHPAA